MEIIDKGHLYRLIHIRGTEIKSTADLVVGTATEVQFVNKEPGREKDGVTTQEILRMLIDRTRYCNNCLPHRVNEEIIYHFRKALVLHEARALERKADSGEIIRIVPEDIQVGYDGHWVLPHRPPGDLETRALYAVERPSNREDSPVYLRHSHNPTEDIHKSAGPGRVDFRVLVSGQQAPDYSGGSSNAPSTDPNLRKAYRRAIALSIVDAMVFYERTNDRAEAELKIAAAFERYASANDPDRLNTHIASILDIGVIDLGAIKIRLADYAGEDKPDLSPGEAKR